ncbi:Acetolactate synthase, mitochondrial [Ceratobasidium sp. 428]|nr:Acetolactate synthase, mitochondrial [Ceratobasidium sp. 428]
MAFAPARVRTTLAPSKGPSAILAWSRQRSTVADRAERASCQLDAKSRVREHARNISRSAPGKAATAPSVRPTPAPGFQQIPQNNPQPFSAPRPTLDHSLTGMSGGQIFHEMMLRHNVKHIFGYPGGAILPVFDAIYNSKNFDFVLPRHEQGAGHMAEGYARVSGKPGVVLVTSGPGATNVVTPMQDALSDGVPLVRQTSSAFPDLAPNGM